MIQIGTKSVPFDLYLGLVLHLDLLNVTKRSEQVCACVLLQSVPAVRSKRSRSGIITHVRIPANNYFNHYHLGQAQV